MKKIKTDFAKNLKKYIIDRGFKVKDFAFLVYVTPQTVRNWVNGKSKPSLLVLVKVAKILKCRLENLLNC